MRRCGLPGCSSFCAVIGGKVPVETSFHSAEMAVEPAAAEPHGFDLRLHARSRPARSSRNAPRSGLLRCRGNAQLAGMAALRVRPKWSALAVMGQVREVVRRTRTRPAGRWCSAGGIRGWRRGSPELRSSRGMKGLKPVISTARGRSGSLRSTVPKGIFALEGAVAEARETFVPALAEALAFQPLVVDLLGRHGPFDQAGMPSSGEDRAWQRRVASGMCPSGMAVVAGRLRMEKSCRPPYPLRQTQPAPMPPSGMAICSRSGPVKVRCPAPAKTRAGKAADFLHSDRPPAG